jgi:hypothetical protein
MLFGVVLLGLLLVSLPTMSFYKKFIDFFTFSDFFVSLGFTSLTATTVILLGLNIDDFIKEIIFVFFGTWLIYNTHRVIGLKNEDKEQLSPPLIWTKDNLSLIAIIFIISGVISLYLFLTFTLNIKIFIVLMTFLSLGYSVRFMRIKNKQLNLREVPFLKLFLVSLVGAFVSVFIIPPALYHEKIWSIMITRICFLLAITIPFDIRDRLIDKQQGILTFPNYFGITKSKLLGWLFLLIYLILVLNSEMIIIHSLMAFLVGILIYFSDKTTSYIYFNVLIESTMTMKFCLFYIFLLL